MSTIRKWIDPTKSEQIEPAKSGGAEQSDHAPGFSITDLFLRFWRRSCSFHSKSLSLTWEVYDEVNNCNISNLAVFDRTGSLNDSSDDEESRMHCDNEQELE